MVTVVSIYRDHISININNDMKAIIQEALDKGFSFEEYRSLFERLVKEGKTTGPNQSEGYVSYTKLNLTRWQRAEKDVEITRDTFESLQDISENITLLVISEAWCGDASQSLPVISRMVEESPNISAVVVLRDENDELMDNFLTNGGKAIPKVIVLNDDLEVLATWGPRPAELQALVVAFKKEKPESTGMDVSALTQKWYVKNKGVSIQEEIVEELLTYCCAS